MIIELFATALFDPQTYFPSAGRYGLANPCPRRSLTYPSATLPIRTTSFASSTGDNRHGVRANARSASPPVSCHENPSAADNAVVMLLLVRRLAGRREQLGRRPGELVGHLRVVVRAAAFTPVRAHRSRDAAEPPSMPSRQRPDTGRRARGPTARRPAHTGARPQQDSAWQPSTGDRGTAAADPRPAATAAGPLLVVDLVVHHPGEWLPGRHLHPEQEVDLPLRLVQDVGIPFPASGIRNVRSPTTPVDRGPLVQVQQLPRRERAVDHVLAVVTRVVPTTSYVEAVVAGPGQQGTDVSPLFGATPRCPAGRAYASPTYCASIGMPLRLL